MVDPWLQPVHFLVDCVDHYRNGDSRHLRCGLRLPGYRPHLTDPPWASLPPNVRAAGICAGIRLLNQGCYVSLGIRVPAGRDVLLRQYSLWTQTHIYLSADTPCDCEPLHNRNFACGTTSDHRCKRQHNVCCFCRWRRCVVPGRWGNSERLGGGGRDKEYRKQFPEQPLAATSAEKDL